MKKILCTCLSLFCIVFGQFYSSRNFVERMADQSKFWNTSPQCVSHLILFNPRMTTNPYWQTPMADAYALPYKPRYNWIWFQCLDSRLTVRTTSTQVTYLFTTTASFVFEPSHNSPVCLTTIPDHSNFLLRFTLNYLSKLNLHNC